MYKPEVAVDVQGCLCYNGQPLWLPVCGVKQLELCKIAARITLEVHLFPLTTH